MNATTRPFATPPCAFALVACPPMGFLEFTDVAYAIPGGWSLFEGVTFRVPDGEHAAMVGANGIGKSTLLRLAAGEESPNAGTVQVDSRTGKQPLTHSLMFLLWR